MTLQKCSLAIALLLFAACDDATSPAPPPADAGTFEAGSASPDLPPDQSDPGPPSLNFTPEQHEFGTVSLGAMSDAVIFTVSNGGPGPATGLAVTLNGADFVLTDDKCGARFDLPAGTRCTFGVQFKPQSRGLKNGSILFTWRDQSVIATLTGRALASDEGQGLISPSQAQLTGTVGVASPPRRFTVANLGDLLGGQLTVRLGGADAGEFALQVNTCVSPLPPSSSCTLEVVLLATSAGMKSATLVVSSTPGGMTVASLTGLALPP
jgi:hypothetical protein